MQKNPTTLTDYYKTSHYLMYPKNTEMVFSNLTPRSNKLSNLPNNNDKLVVFGIQYFIKDYLIKIWDEGFFKQPKEKVIKEYKRRMDTSLGEGAVGVEQFEKLHDLGYLPLEIKALPEGSRVKTGIPILTVRNTHKDFFWLTNYIESIMSTYLWKMCTNATTAYWYKQLFLKYAEETGSSKEFCQFQGHDFSFRGMSGLEDAASSGAGHLLSFVGTDTIPAIDFLEEYYNANSEKELIGCSVPASEHAVTCIGSAISTEEEFFRDMINVRFPNGIVSLVSDTWDYWGILTNTLPKLKDDILKRNGKVVVRPDSGDPVKIVCGDHTKAVGTPEYKGSIEVLWNTFGGTINAEGYKELDSHIGLIYGDSITPERAEAILQYLEEKGFAASNVVFGIGSYTYNYSTRDTWGFAVKATYSKVDGKGYNVFKEPKTDSGTKKSHKGLLTVTKDSSGEFMVNQEVDENEYFYGNVENELKTVFLDGVLTKEETLANIRERLKG